MNMTIAARGEETMPFRDCVNQAMIRALNDLSRRDTVLFTAGSKQAQALHADSGNRANRFGNVRQSIPSPR